MTDEQIIEMAKTHCVDATRISTVLSFARALLASKPAVMQPIDMLLFCPDCGTQHIDAPEEREIDKGSHIDIVCNWTNPPHRSHLCHACETIWRPADVPTNGVASITTKGKADTWGAASPTAPAQPCGDAEQADEAVTLSDDEASDFERVVDDFEDCSETSTDYEILMDWARRGLLECVHFKVTKAGQNALAARTKDSK